MLHVSHSEIWEARLQHFVYVSVHIFFVFFFFFGVYVLYHGYIPGVGRIRNAVPQLAAGSSSSTVPLCTGTAVQISLYIRVCFLTSRRLVFSLLCDHWVDVREIIVVFTKQYCENLIASISIITIIIVTIPLRDNTQDLAHTLGYIIESISFKSRERLRGAHNKMAALERCLVEIFP